MSLRRRYRVARLVGSEIVIRHDWQHNALPSILSKRDASTLYALSESRSVAMDTETLILAASQIAGGIVAGRGRDPRELIKSNEAEEIAKAAVTIAMAIGEKADAALSG